MKKPPVQLAETERLKKQLIAAIAYIEAAEVVIKIARALQATADDLQGPLAALDALKAPRGRK